MLSRKLGGQLQGQLKSEGKAVGTKHQGRIQKKAWKTVRMCGTEGL
jgi:hypothetical protein